MDTKKTKFDVTGMTCSACSANVEKAVKKLQNVSTVNVNLLANSMTVEFTAGNNATDEVIAAVQNAGYNALIHGAVATKKSDEPDLISAELKSMKWRLIISFAFMIPLFYISMGHMANWWLPRVFLGTSNALTFAFTQFLLCLPIVFVNQKYFRVGFKALWKRSPNMDSLIAIGSTAAIVHGIYSIYKIGWGLGNNDLHMVHTVTMNLYLETAAMILALITLGKYLETRSKGKTSEAITKLINLAPKTATVLRGDNEGVEYEVPIEEVQIGDLVVVKSGQSIPVDGVITKGSAAVDESALTGESLPVEKQVGDKVTGASINKSGFFILKATKVGDDTALAQIIHLVEEASASKAPIAKLADKVSSVFVPIVIGIAVLSVAVWLILGAGVEFSLAIGIAVLVISCPCALGLATPTAIMVGTGKGAENGILIKSAEALEIAHSIDTIVLDKTGTITEGKPQVTDILPSGKITKQQLILLAASIEKPSEHPLALAIVEEAERQNLTLLKVDTFTAIAGRGLCVGLEGGSYYAGNKKLMEDRGIISSALEATAASLAKEGKTPLFFADETALLGVVAVADVIKPTSKKAVEQLTAMGINVVMITGDNAATAAAIQQQVGIAHIIAEVLPQDKEREVRALQQAGKKVAMVGDGINDAPALARADVGIAIGAGTDVAIESADIVLMKSDLLDAVSAIQLSKAVIRNIKQNLFWALVYNAIGIPLAAGVFFSLLGWQLNPMFGAAAMSLSSVCVVTNALRLKLFRPKLNQTPHLFTPQIIMRKEEEKMFIKNIVIDGMMCAHCTGRVEAALTATSGVTAVTVDLATKTATVTLSSDMSPYELSKPITEAGYTVVSVA